MNLFTQKMQWWFCVAIAIFAIQNAKAQCGAPNIAVSTANTLCEQSPLEIVAAVAMPPGCILANNAFHWTSPGGSLPASTGTGYANLASAAIGDYSVVVFYTQDPATGAAICSCASSDASNVITVRALPTAPTVVASGTSGTNFQICTGSNLTFIASSTNGTTGAFHWYDAAGQLLFIGNPYISAPYTATTNITVAEVINGCEGTAQALNITVDNTATVALPSAANATTCAGGTATLQATVVSGLSYKWYNDAALTDLVGQGATLVTLPLIANKTYYLVAQQGQCFSDALPVDVAVTALAQPTVAATTNICSGNTATLTASTIETNVSFVWYDNNVSTTIPIYTGNPFTTPRLYTVASYSVQITQGTCVSSTITAIVSPSVVVAVPTANGVDFCEGSSATLEVTNGAADDVFHWYNSATGGNLLQIGSVYTTLPLLATTNFWVSRLTDAGFCESDRTEVVATMNINPGTPIASGTNICNGQTVTLSAIGGQQLDWYMQAVGGNVIAANTATYTTSALTQNTTFYVQASNPLTACTSSRTPVTVVVRTPVNPPAVQSNIEICFGTNATIPVTGSGVTGNAIRWYNLPIGGVLQNTVTITSASPTQTWTTINPLFATINYYVCEYNALTGCESVRVPVRIQVNPQLYQPQAADVAVCNGTAGVMSAAYNVSSTTNGVFRWFSAATGGNLLFIGQNFTASPAITTNYYVEEYANGCASTRQQVILNIKPNPTIASTTPATICAEATAALSATGSAGSTLKWYADASASQFLANGLSLTTTPLQQTTTFFVQSTFNGCVSAVTPVVATVTALPTQPTATDITFCSNQNVVLNGSGSGNGVLNWYNSTANTPPVHVSTMAGVANQNYQIGTSILTAGVYTYYITEKLGTCESQRTPITLTVNAVADAPNVVPLTICQNTQAILNATHAGATTGQFLWFSDAACTNQVYTGNGYETANLTVNTTFYVKEVSGVCTSVAKAFPVIVTPNPTIASTPPATICAEAQATLSAVGSSASVALQWYADATASLPLANGNNSSYTTVPLQQTTTFFVQATLNGCVSAVTPVVATVTALPTQPTATDITFCSNQNIVLNGSGSGNGVLNWYNSTANTPPVHVSTMAGIANQNYQIGTNILTAGVYTYYITEKIGACESQRTPITLTVNQQPAPLALADRAICASSTAVLDVIPATNNILRWYDAATNGNLLHLGNTYPVSPLTTTTYYVTQAVLGCESVAAPLILTVNALPATPAPSSNGVLCEHTQLQLNANVTGVVYEWTGPNGVVMNNIATPTISNISEANHEGVYSLRVQNPTTSCWSLAGSTVVSINPTPQTPTFLNNSGICEGETLKLLTDAITDASYTWSGAGIATPLTTTTSFTNIANATLAMSGVYTVFATLNGCQSPTGTTTVRVKTVPFAPTATGDVVCAGSTASLQAATTINGLYFWTGPNGYSSTDQHLILLNATAAKAGTYQVNVTVEGCTSAPSVTTLVVNALPVLATAATVTAVDNTLCEGETLQLNCPSVNNVAYTWSGPSGYTSNDQNPVIQNVLQGSNQGVYNVVLENLTTGCISKPSPALRTNVVVNARLRFVEASNNSPICTGDTLRLFASIVLGATYSWTGPESFTSTENEPFIPNAQTDNTGMYNVTITDANGCTAVAGANTVAAVYPSPSVNAGADITITEGQNAQLNASGGVNYQWTAAAGTVLNNAFTNNPLVLNPPIGIYTFTVRSYNGAECAATDAVKVTVRPRENLGIDDAIQNILTPNGDGENDVWKVAYLQNFKENLTVIILDRDGAELVHRTTYFEWDGRNDNGVKLPDGTYYYIIKTPQKDYKGGITLLNGF
jgi:large repetitive protein